MPGKPSRFGGFLQPAATPAAEDAPAPEPTPVPAEEVSASQPYLLRRFSRDEAVARLGNGVRSTTKHRLEDYVRELKRGGWPATEARVMEAMFELLDEDPEFRSKVTAYLTGQT